MQYIHPPVLHYPPNHERSPTHSIHLPRANTIILTFLFGGLAWAINHDYNGAFTKWFIQMFPSEAGTLGLVGS